MADIFDITTRALANSISARGDRANIISSNIANAETPDYHAKRLDFEKALESAIDRDYKSEMSPSIRASEIPGSKSEVYDDPLAEINNDGNTVNMEREMAQLTENNIMYRAAIQSINKKLAALKYAASDGGR